MADPPDKPTPAPESAPDDGGTVAPLPDEERRKLFDLPAATPVTARPAPRPAGQDPSFLELDDVRGNTTASSRAPGKVVQTIRVRGIAALVFTAAVTTVTLWVICFVYRY